MSPDVHDKLLDKLEGTFTSCYCGICGYLVLPDCEEESHMDSCASCIIKELRKELANLHKNWLLEEIQILKSNILNENEDTYVCSGSITVDSVIKNFAKDYKKRVLIDIIDRHKQEIEKLDK